MNKILHKTAIEGYKILSKKLPHNDDYLIMSYLIDKSEEYNKEYLEEFNAGDTKRNDYLNTLIKFLLKEMEIIASKY